MILDWLLLWLAVLIGVVMFRLLPDVEETVQKYHDGRDFEENSRETERGPRR